MEQYDGTPADFRVTVTRHDQSVLIGVRGELDIATAPQVQAAVSDAAAGLAPGDGRGGDGRGLVIVDLTPCSFLDSTGCRAIALSSRGMPADVRLVLICPEANREVYRVLDFVQISAAVKIYETPGEVFADLAVTPPEGLARP